MYSSLQSPVVHSVLPSSGSTAPNVFSPRMPTIKPPASIGGTTELYVPGASHSKSPVEGSNALIT